ncbi:MULTISPECIES: DUF7666 domain-containing protein [Butyricimonas]|uniref:DUF7666 domain-containing protein n=1 Tax=Butyricimonas TaxID=574697 RepID=UPI0007FB33F7|nr:MULTISPECIES: hypothetical protein [Butyricimonas]
MKAYKGFKKDFTCRGFQFEEGKEYEEKEAVLCEKGFHACINPLDVLNYYKDIDNRYCEIELDEVSNDKKYNDSKICGKRIKINAEIGFIGLFKMGIEWLKEQTIFSKNDIEELEKSSGNDAKIGSSGDYAKIGSSGNDAKIGSSGNDAKIGSSGDYAKIGSSGDYAKIGSSGDDAKIGSSGDYAKIGSSGDYAKIGSSGDYAKIGSSGDYAKIGSSGYNVQIGSSGDYAKIGSSGNDAKIGSSGDYAKIGSSGDYAKIGSSGDYAKIGSSGKNSVVMCAGCNSIAKAKIGSWITLAEYKYENGEWVPVNVVTKKVDGIEIKEDTYYKLVNGVFTEVNE